MGKKRSIGVTVFACLFIIRAVIILLLLAVLDMESKSVSFLQLSFLPVIILSIMFILVGKDLLRLKELSRKWAINLSIFAILMMVVSYIHSKSINALEIIQLFILSPLTIFFFTRPKVKEQFK